jgi:chemotaxis protein MotB
MRTARCILAVGCGLVVLLMIGCGPGPKDLQIQALQEEVDRLQAEKGDLMAQLSRAQSERDEARGRNFDLQQRLAELQAEMARARDTAQIRGDWTEAPGIAWQDVDVDILFDSGKATLKQAAQAKLDTIVADIRSRYPGRQIWVIGHTDSDPIKHSNWKDNLELSVQRACTVFRALQGKGLDPQQMVAAGQGEFNPKAENAPKTKQLNRRVQIIAVEVPDTTHGPAMRERG